MLTSERLGHEPFCTGGFGNEEKCDCVFGEIKPEVAQLEAENAALQKQVEGLETEIYRQMQGKRLLAERHAATGHLLRDFNDNYKKIKDKYANLQKILDGMDDCELLKEYRNWKAIREAEEGGDDVE